ncbi:hypothetical protein ASE12_10095 [Aeromicrobium sp. Root236]|nr:hypothetical protein ASE12_10095 [Aeromicrobium sp. Root236]
MGGVAGLAALLVVAPAALAEDAPTPEPTETTDPGASTPTPDPTDEPTTPGETTEPTEPTPEPTEGTDPAPDPTTGVPGQAQLGAHKIDSSKTAEAAEVEPVFGSQKYRVGVQVADGSYVPAGTTTAGTTITITETGPLVPDGSRTVTCETDASTQTMGSTATYCLAKDVPETSRAKANLGGVTVTPGNVPPDQAFFSAPGSTVTIQQTTVMPNLLRDTTTATINPCVVSGEGDPCPNSGFTALFNDPGLPPIAVDDKATTDEGVAVDIDVLDNDDPVNGAPVSGLTVISDPGDGTADVDNGEITYTPDDGFTGTDTFDYRYSTPNGTASATVTVRVRPKETSPVDDQVLPDTGGADARLFGIGALLLAAGGWLTVRGRRPGAHAPSD